MAISPLDFSELEGGLARMLHRFLASGTLTGDRAADEDLRQHPEAALLGLLFDQRVLAETAFTGPMRLRDRLGHLDLGRIATMEAETLRAVFAEKPAVHRFTNTMADTTLKLATVMARDYDGQAARLWNDGADAPTLEKRIQKLPGFGKDKARKLKYLLHYLGYRDFSER
jgi:uncharacterized HhH-GPD family protein